MSFLAHAQYRKYLAQTQAGAVLLTAADAEGYAGDALILSLIHICIEIDGNKAITTEDLLKGLNPSGLAEGEIFQRATLDGVRNELQRQYVAQGRYCLLYTSRCV